MSVWNISNAALDQIASRTWPAEEVQTMGGWLLRASQGVTKRANSVLATGNLPSDSDWLQQIENFYKSRDLPAIFHIGAETPNYLDELLEANGYVKEVPCLLMTACSQEVEDKSLNALLRKNLRGFEFEMNDVADEMWIDNFIKMEQFPAARKSFYQGLFDRMPANRCFLMIRYGGEAIAAGVSIVENDWAGFINIVVKEEFRGKGVSYLLMHHLTQWSLEHGASSQYLQVIAENETASKLYGNLGYTPLFGYHYRCKYDL